MTVAFTDEQVALIARTILRPRNRQPTQDEVELFVHQAVRTELDPFSGQLYAQYRTSQGAERMSVQATIDGFRLIAERSGQYLGQQGPYWCGDDGTWLEVWPKAKGNPTAAKVVVQKLLGGQIAPTPAVAHWDEYAVTGAAGHMWSSKPALMLAKCAEALALRKAFPNKMSGIYTAEEMSQADQPAAAAPATPAYGQQDATPLSRGQNLGKSPWRQPGGSDLGEPVPTEPPDTVPLWDGEMTWTPDELIESIKAKGINAESIKTVLRTATVDPKGIDFRVKGALAEFLGGLDEKQRYYVGCVLGAAEKT
jgi:phage recombination protein Bet